MIISIGMPQHDITTILVKFKEFEERQSDTHTQLFARIQELDDKIDPVVRIYGDLSGTGRIIKWCIVSLTLVIGLAAGIKAILR